MKLTRKSSLAALLLLLASSTVYAQTGGTGQIVGNVRDSSGLAVADAEVQALQTETGLNRTLQTAADGGFTLSSLPTGPYRLQVRKEGFSTFVQSGIVLQVGSSSTVDVVMKVGAVSEQVTVQADAAMVETHSTGVGQVVDQRRVTELPLNGRQPQYLIFLAGAATDAPPGNLNSTKNYPTVVISVAGATAAGMTYNLDGATHNDPFSNQALPIPFPDVLQEFKLETSALPAQYGQHSAAAVNAITKSGGNAFHGNAFEFLRNGNVNARNFFASKSDTLKRNQFGGTFGGPIKKDRIFFFLGYQETLQRSDPNNGVAFIPTTAMLGGDFTAFAAPGCNGGRQLNLNAPYVGNKIAPSLYSPAALKIMTYYPQTTDPCGRTTYGSVANTNEYLGLGRVDFQLSDKHSLFTRYYGAHYFQNSPYVSGGNPLALNNAGIEPTDHAIAVGDTYLFSASVVNSFRTALNRAALPKTQNNAFGPADVGIKAYSYMPFMVLTAGSFITGSVFAHAGYYNSTTTQMADDVSWQHGSHQFGFGGNWIHSLNNNQINLNASGQYTFSGQFSGTALGDFLTGQLSAMTQGNPGLLYDRQHYIGLYAQDSWKVNSRLTVSYGLRWEPFLPIRLKQDRLYRFNQQAFAQNLHSRIYPNGPAGLFFPGDPGFDGATVTNQRMGKFAPRIGLVLDPMGDGKMTVRASYGLFYSTTHLFYDQQFAYSNPFGNLIAANLTGGVKLDNPWQNYPGGNPFPLALTKNSFFPPNGSTTSYTPNAQPTYMQQWNFSVQRQVGSNWLLSATYIGNNTMHGWTWKQVNPGVLTPGASVGNIATRRALYLQNPSQGQYYSTVNLLDDGGTASYQGALFSVQRRLSNGLTVLANYTWSHCITDPIPNDGGGGGGYVNPNNRNYDRGNCVGIDRRHNVNFSSVYEVPRFQQRALALIASGWQLSSIVSALSGSSFTITSGVDSTLTGIGSQRPNFNGADPYNANRGVNGWFNNAAFAAPASGQYGNVGIGNVVGPGKLQIDMSLSRTFSVRERYKMQVRAEGFNIPNRLNGSAPTLALNSPNFGKILSDISTSAGAQASGPGAGDSRVLQLGLKISF